MLEKCFKALFRCFIEDEYNLQRGNYNNLLNLVYFQKIWGWLKIVRSSQMSNTMQNLRPQKENLLR